MANSPGPSSSKTAEASTSKDSHPNETDKFPKKKRTRRKPRSKIKKDVPDDARPTLEESIQNTAVTSYFVIEPVKEPLAIVYRQCDKPSGHIRLNWFTKHKTVPRVSETETVTNHILQIGKVSLNSVGTLSTKCLKKPQNNEAAPVHGDKKKREYRKGGFPQYMSKEEVEVGLKNGELLKGYIRINPKNFKESYVGNEDLSKSDYVIESVLDRNRALEGDEVVLRLKNSNENKKIMEVVYIMQKVHTRSAVGNLTPLDKNKESALFIPRDKRIPKMKIPKLSWPSGFYDNPKLYHDILFVARIAEWRTVKFALGTIVENLGLTGDLKVESLAILREFCLDPTPYGNDVKEFLPDTSDISPAEYACREDIRRECVFTIDPLTARDLDDAVSCKELSNGNFEVGVHISDASYYLQENTKLDDLVRSKATTIYMVDTAYHMLPVELCLHCSLLPGQDKLSFSVFWELTPQGEIVHKRFARTVMNSCVQLAYEHAQLMIDEPEKSFREEELPTIYNGFASADLSRVVNNLQGIAVCLRKKRVEGGSLKIDQVKISFLLDPSTGEPLNFFVYENNAAHRLIEEFMLLANMTVARQIVESFPKLAFLRLHEAPKQTMIAEVQRNLETLGIHIDISSSGGIQASLDKYIDDDFFGQVRMLVLNHLLAKPMKRARYFCAGAIYDETGFGHFALNIPIYTHFTSPIRRYADIMVHRLLAASLNYRDRPQWQPEEVAAVAETCNRQKYNAKKAGEASSELYLAHYVEKHEPFVQQAVVINTSETSADVMVLSTGSVVRIYLNNIGENVTWKSEKIEVQRRTDDSNVKSFWKILVTFPEPETFVVLEIFTLVRVELSRKLKTNKLQAQLLRPT